MEVCDSCLHQEVCGKFRATGGVKQCKHFAPLCRHCASWDKAVANKKGFLICPASGMEIMAHDYCSYGEGRGDDGDHLL